MDEFAYSEKFGGIQLNIAHQNYIKQIIREIDGSDMEKADIAEEIAIHLQLTSDHFVEAGYEKKEAEKLAMNEFGKTNEIGKQMQEAMFPFRKLMFMILVVSSFLYAYIAYSIKLFSEGDAHIGWLIMAVISSSLLLLFVLRVFPKLDRKLTLNSMLIIHIFTFAYGTFLASSWDNDFSYILSIFAWAIVLFTLGLIYRTTIVDSQKEATSLSKHTKIIHFLNITFGVFIIIGTLFFLWALLAFGEEFYLRMTLIFIPFLIWLVTYYIQIRLTKNNKQIHAYFVALIPAIMFVAITIWWFQ